MISSGMSALWRWMGSATGRILSSANRRNVSCTISKSSSRWRGPGPSIDARNAGSRWAATNARAASRAVGLDRSGRMRQVVGDDLIGVDRAGGGQVGERPVDDAAGGLDGGSGGVEVGRGHAGRRYSAAGSSAEL